MTSPQNGGGTTIATLATATAKLIRTERRHERFHILTLVCAVILGGQAADDHRWFAFTVITVALLWISVGDSFDHRKNR